MELCATTGPEISCVGSISRGAGRGGSAGRSCEGAVKLQVDGA